MSNYMHTPYPFGAVPPRAAGPMTAPLRPPRPRAPVVPKPVPAFTDPAPDHLAHILPVRG